MAHGSWDIGHNSAGMSAGAQTFALSEIDFCNSDASRELNHSINFSRNERASFDIRHFLGATESMQKLNDSGSSGKGVSRFNAQAAGVRA